MASEIFILLESGGPVDVDLLATIPDNLDRSKWKLPPWKNYQPLSFPVLATNRGGEGGLTFKIDVSFPVPSGVFLVACLGLSSRGTPLFFAPLEQEAFAFGGQTFKATIAGQIQPVQQ